MPVIALTDEELAALDGGPDGSPVAPQPWLDAQDEASRQVICQVALRGLTARGIVVPAGAGEDGRDLVAIHQNLRAALSMRHSALALVLAQRQAGAECAYRVLFLHEDAAVLEEDVTHRGLHRLSVMDAAAAAERLATFVDPMGAAGDQRPKPARTVSLADVAGGAGIPDVGAARFVTMVGRLARPEPNGGAEPAERRLTVYALPDRVVVAEPALTDTGEAGLTMSAVGAAALERRLAALLHAAPSEAG